METETSLILLLFSRPPPALLFHLKVTFIFSCQSVSLSALLSLFLLSIKIYLSHLMHCCHSCFFNSTCWRRNACASVSVSESVSVSVSEYVSLSLSLESVSTPQEVARENDHQCINKHTKYTDHIWKCSEPVVIYSLTALNKRIVNFRRVCLVSTCVHYRLVLSSHCSCEMSHSHVNATLFTVDAASAAWAALSLDERRSDRTALTRTSNKSIYATF